MPQLAPKIIDRADCVIEKEPRRFPSQYAAAKFVLEMIIVVSFAVNLLLFVWKVPTDIATIIFMTPFLCGVLLLLLWILASERTVLKVNVTEQNIGYVPQDALGAEQYLQPTQATQPHNLSGATSYFLRIRNWAVADLSMPAEFVERIEQYPARLVFGLSQIPGVSPEKGLYAEPLRVEYWGIVKGAGIPPASTPGYRVELPKHFGRFLKGIAALMALLVASTVAISSYVGARYHHEKYCEITDVWADEEDNELHFESPECGNFTMKEKYVPNKDMFTLIDQLERLQGVHIKFQFGISPVFGDSEAYGVEDLKALEESNP
ncbi:hypothetical protein HF984_07160 [Rothia terrae]|uniref:hypothetical protein n=1 Tax=Rothia terrae TaxID=396015 RepID=UPI00144612B7|nr:hypothetical protein [Rothia terrae]NKZ34541.1 hypothetical protein [Rothia terrae]